MTIRGLSGLNSDSPVLRLFRVDSASDQLFFRPFPYRSASLDRSKGRLNPTISSHLWIALQKMRLTKDDRVISPKDIFAGNRSTLAVFLLSSLYFSKIPMSSSSRSSA